MSSGVDARFVRAFILVTVVIALMLLAIIIAYVNPELAENTSKRDEKLLASVEVGGVRVSLEGYGFAEKLCVENISLKKKTLYFIILVDARSLGEAYIGVPRLTISNNSYEPVDLDDVVFHAGKKPEGCDVEVDDANMIIKLFNSVRPLRAEGRIVIAFTGVKVGVPMSLSIPVEILPRNFRVLFTFNITISSGTFDVTGASAEVR